MDFHLITSKNVIIFHFDFFAFANVQDFRHESTWKKLRDYKIVIVCYGGEITCPTTVTIGPFRVFQTVFTRLFLNTLIFENTLKSQRKVQRVRREYTKTDESSSWCFFNAHVTIFWLF